MTLTEKIHKLYEEFIYKRTYARWLEEENRRETWQESCLRFYQFFKDKGFDIPLDAIKNKLVMPSMRAFWSAGPALDEHHIACYNCAYLSIDSPDKFGEMLYILMHGTGVGFSVERQYIQKLPTVPEQLLPVDTSFIVPDSKEGWANTTNDLIFDLYDGYIPNIDYSLLRPKGARLKKFGGRSSGPEPLIELHKFILRVFDRAKGRQLNSLEVHDICCKIAECVVVGGVRRSACISFSNASDQRMKHAKDGQFWLDNPQRTMSNNSIAYTEKPDCSLFMEEWLNLMRSGSGERGIVNVQAAKKKALDMGRTDGDFRCNPCAEAILKDAQFCNLTEVIVRPDDTKESLKAKIRDAVYIGCVQATLTDFKNVSSKWYENCTEEPLLGVSLTGVCDNRLFHRVNDKTRKLLLELKEYAHECSIEFAKECGLKTNPKQVTLVKPSGTVSQLVNSSSGLHPRYSDYYIRRVRVNAKDPIAKLLVDKGVPCNPEVGQTWEDYNTLVFAFPIKSPRGSLQRTDFTAIEQLEYWKMFNECWCDGNPSVTIYIREDEWVEVGAWVYSNWDSVCGLSFLPYDGAIYPLAPYEEINRDKYEELCRLFSRIELDFDNDLPLYEVGDTTTGAKTYACTGDSCELS